MVRNIVRPRSILTTPRNLQDALGARRTRGYPNDRDAVRHNLYDWGTDLFTVYPPANLVRNVDETYLKLHSFYSSDKPSQRRLLERVGVKVVPFATTRGEAESLPSRQYKEGDGYIVRPLRHSAGRDYKHTSSESDFVEGREYISVVFPKKREYRVIFTKGVPIITLRKRVPEGSSYLEPWNHAVGGHFVTVEHEENNHILKTSCMEDLGNCDYITNAHVVGVDILLDAYNRNYAVLETNTCPAITLDHNLAKMKEVWNNA